MWMPTKRRSNLKMRRSFYAFVQAAVKHAAGTIQHHSCTWFWPGCLIQQLPSIQQPFTEEKKAAAASGSIFKGFTQKHQAHFIERQIRVSWNTGGISTKAGEPGVESQESALKPGASVHHLSFTIHPDTELSQLLNTYITFPSANGFLLIHQQAAHERVVWRATDEGR